MYDDRGVLILGLDVYIDELDNWSLGRLQDR